jgi:peroxiredoxin Q/BCP
LRDAADELAQLGVRVLGISVDDVATQAAFAKAQKLDFSLLSDPDASVAGKFDAMMAERPFSKRLTFVIDPDGTLRHIDDKVQVGTHGTDMVALVRKLKD